jgi:hypothetical protein
MCATIVRSSAMRRPAALFVYSRDRAAEHPERHLQGYAGMILDVGMAGSRRLLRSAVNPVKVAFSISPCAT